MSNGKDTKQFLEALLGQGPAVKIIASALTTTISKYTKSSVTVGKPYVRETHEKSDLAVVGLIRCESTDLKLEICLGFSRQLFLKLYESMFQTETTEITPANQDLAGEILNIAFGVMDPEFRKLGTNLQCSFPVIHSGEKWTKALADIQSTAIVLPYTCGKHTFLVEIYAPGSLPEKWKFEGAHAA